MTIVAECPHCESRFNLQPDILGKSMRCPNLACRQIFTATNLDGSITPPAPVIIEATVVEATAVEMPREVEWSASMSEPGSRRKVTAVVIDDDDEPLRPRRKKRGRPMLLIGFLSFAVVALLGLGVFYVFRINILGETKLAKQADAELKAGEFPAAARSYKQLLDEFPGSAEAPRYRFSADLAALRAAIQSVGNREDPFPSADKFRSFVGEYRESEFAKPQSGLGSDVFAGGSKLLDDMTEHGRDHLTKYRTDRSKPEELAKADRTAREGPGLLPLLEPFRDKDVPMPASLKEGFLKLEQEVQFERERADFLAKLREDLREPTDETIAEADTLATRRGLQQESDVVQVIQDARAVLRGQVKYVAARAPAQPAPPIVGTSLLFATPVGKTVQTFAAAGEIPGTFLAQARGILYALDERTGSLLWAQRVGPGNAEPVRYTPEEGGEGLALVTSDVAGQPAITARRLRTGEPLWHQPLPAQAAGSAVVVARRVYVPTRTARGTVVEFDLASGEKLGSISLGQLLGPGAIRRPGTGLLYIPADARRVFVLDVEARNDDGIRLEPRLVQILATGHTPGSVRTVPLVVGPEGEGPEPHWLVLAQSDGPRSTRLRTFRLPEGAVGGDKPIEAAQPAEVEYPLAGWPWFPPAYDGERLAVVTDAGAFYLFGVSQAGGQDRPLYPIAPGAVSPDPKRDPEPGLVVSNSDDVFWVVKDGSLVQLRLMLDASRGQVLGPVGSPVVLGMPTQKSHLNAAGNTAYFVVRSGGTRAVAWDLAEGRMLWTRQLGLLPASLPLVHGSNLLVADEVGGLSLVPRTALDPQPPGDRVAEAGWKIAAPPGDATGPTILVPAAEADAAWAITPRPDAFTIRRIENGKVAAESKVNAPARLAGAPIESNHTLLLPLADGFVHRLDAASGRLVPGPIWRDSKGRAEAECFMTPVKGNEFLATDGHREVRRWLWPTDGSDWKRQGEKFVSREQIAAAPVIVNGAKNVMLVDRLGSAWLHDFSSGEVLRRWRSGGTSPIPLGTPTSRLVQASGRIAYIVDGKALVMIDPEQEGPAKAALVPEGGPGTLFVGDPVATAEGNWLVADLAGRCTEFEGTTLAPRVVRSCGASGALPTLGVTVIEGMDLAIPLADGSMALVGSKVSEAPMPRGQ